MYIHLYISYSYTNIHMYTYHMYMWDMYTYHMYIGYVYHMYMGYVYGICILIICIWDMYMGYVYLSYVYGICIWDMYTYHMYMGTCILIICICGICSYMKVHVCTYKYTYMRWLPLVGSLKLQVSFAEYRLFYRALLQKRPII